MFKNKCGFEEALAALKNGKSIQRNKDYSTRYVRMDSRVDGELNTRLGTFDSKRGFEDGCRFNQEDVCAEDWIIEN